MLLIWDLKIIQRIAVLSIIGQHKFYSTLSNFLDIIGYWIGDIQALECVNQRTDDYFFSRRMGVRDLC